MPLVIGFGLEKTGRSPAVGGALMDSALYRVVADLVVSHERP